MLKDADICKGELRLYPLTAYLLAYWQAWTCHCGMCWDKDHKSKYREVLDTLDQYRFEDFGIPSYEA